MEKKADEVDKIDEGEDNGNEINNEKNENENLMLSTPLKAPLEGVKELPKRKREKTEEREHIISLLVENKFGVLARIAGLFAGRGYNIESLSVGVTEDPQYSRMTISTIGERRIIDQIIKQLDKIIEVDKVEDITDVPHVERELALIKVSAEREARDEIIRLVEIFRAKIVDVTLKSFIIEITGTSDKISAFLELLKPFGIMEIARTGKTALKRGNS